MNLTYSSVVNIGLRRAQNCDATVIKKIALGRLFLLADGHTTREGDEYDAYLAAKICCQDIADKMGKYNFSGLEETLKKSVNLAHQRLRKENQEFSKILSKGTTLVAGLVAGNNLIFTSIGDSRIYSILNGTIRQLSEDEIDDQGNLIQAVGRSETLDIRVRWKVLFPGEKLLFCSDGLYKMVSNDSILSIILNQTDLHKATRELMMTANKNGGDDNISAILVEVFEYN